LRGKARERERWYVGAPALLIFGLGLTILLGWSRLRGTLRAFAPRRGNETVPAAAGESGLGGNNA